MQDTFDTEFNDASFLDAFSSLAARNELSGSKHLKLNSRQARDFREQYRAEVGTTKGWEGAYAYTNFDYSDDSDLQRVTTNNIKLNRRLLRVVRIKRLDKQTQMFIDQQQDAADANAEMMEEMMNQPMFSAQQAALPRVQYKAKTPDPMPVQPAPAPTMNISPAPAPELVNVGNPMGIVKQSNTARSRSRQRTRGTASLT